MIERGLVSCGAMANIFGNALRKLGVPAKFIHGRYEYQKTGETENRHSWLEIFNPFDGTWLSIDPTKKDFKLLPDARYIKTYHNWEEMRDDYDKGEF